MKLSKRYHSSVHIPMLLFLLALTGGRSALSQEAQKAPASAKTSGRYSTGNIVRPAGPVRQPSVQASETVTMEPLYSQEKRDLTGDYVGRINFPEIKLTGRAKIFIKGNSFTIEMGEKGEERTIEGQVAAVTTADHVAVNLRYKQADGTFGSLSLKLKQVGRRIWLTNVREEGTSFQLTLECPDYPGCLESDPCIPTCNPPKKLTPVRGEFLRKREPDPPARPPL